MTAEPFQIAVPDVVLDDLAARLRDTRWPDAPQGARWDLGADLAYMQALARYWRDEFDWRAAEEKLNAVPQFHSRMDALDIHFVHIRGERSGALPIVLTHGWPGSFYEFYRLIPLLTRPSAFGGDPADAFDVVAPSLPGFGCSERPKQRGVSLATTSDLWASLMHDLGYARFAVAGSDFGAILSQHLARRHARSVLGIHISYIGYTASSPPQQELSEAERLYLQRVQQWVMREGGYALVQSTRPQTLGFALNDSPIGLAAWLVDKFRAWTDCGGELERVMSKDEILTHVMLYWATGTITSSMRTYAENPPEKIEDRVEVPCAFASFPKDLNPPPREWVARKLNLRRFTEMPRGGHFPAIETPELLANDIRAFFGELRA